MIRQFREFSTWRKYDIVINPHETYTLNFNDTLPNVFVVNNPNLAVLKIGITSIPRSDNYEFKVEYNTTETVGRPIGSNNIYILNDSSVPAKIVVFSIEKDFEPSLLKNMNVSLEGYTIDAESNIAGFKEGVSLPSGSNTIGKVGLSDDVVHLLSMASTGETQQKIFTQLCHFNDKMLECFYDVSENELKTIQNQLNSLNDSVKLLSPLSYKNNSYFEFINNGNEESITISSAENYRFLYFDYLFNDSDSDLTFNIENSQGNVLHTPFTLLANEKLRDIYIPIPSGCYLTTSCSNYKWRARYIICDAVE